MAMDKITKSFISVMILIFIIVTFAVLFGGYAYELKWHVNRVAERVFNFSPKKKQVKIKKVDFRPYMAEVQNRFKKTWQPPKTNVDAKIDVEFDVAKDGKVQNIRIIKSSGNEKTDTAVKDAIMKASPLPPLPMSYDAENLMIKYTFEIKAEK